jgi:hypothetical protein
MAGKPVQFNWRRHWKKKVEPHLHTPLVQTALDFGMRFLDPDWKTGDAPYALGEPKLGGRVVKGKLSWYQPIRQCHWIVFFSFVIGKFNYPHLRWDIVSGDAHTVAVGFWEDGEAEVVMDILLYYTMTGTESLQLTQLIVKGALPSNMGQCYKLFISTLEGGMGSLIVHLLLSGREPLADPEWLDTMLADCWDLFAGSDQGGMEADKLLGRMEDVVWTPPVLTFVVERHGGTVCGSTRAELQHWALDFNAMTATITGIGHRQVAPVAPRLSIKAIAEEVAQAILDCNPDERLRWLDDNVVRVRTSSVFPTGSGFKMTVKGRRMRLCRYVWERLAGHGWLKKGWNEFKKAENVTTLCEKGI